jgi:hypothetical protein
MNKQRRAAIGAALSIAALAFAPVHAQTRESPNIGKTPEGIAWVTGGVTAEGLTRLAQIRDKYSLWITTAAMRSGAHLSDVDVKITNTKTKKVVLEKTMLGPWLFVDLPLGTYLVEATFKDETQKRTTTIHPKDRHQVIMYFDVPAEVSPEWKSPFESSPYSGRKN